MKKALIILTALLAVSTFAKPAKADLILGGQLFYTGGDVTITVLPASASFHSFLGLYLLGDPNSLLSAELLENHDTGGTVTLTAADLAALGYSAGDELVFGIRVSSDDDSIYVMGPGDRNPDGVMHAELNTDDAPNVYIVGFEDLNGGGDEDYNDNIFSFTGGVSVPEPGTLLLLGAGLFGIGARRRMKAKA